MYPILPQSHEEGPLRGFMETSVYNEGDGVACSI